MKSACDALSAWLSMRLPDGCTYHDDDHARMDGARYALFWTLHLAAHIVGLVPAVEGPQSRVQGKRVG